MTEEQIRRYRRIPWVVIAAAIVWLEVTLLRGPMPDTNVITPRRADPVHKGPISLEEAKVFERNTDNGEEGIPFKVRVFSIFAVVVGLAMCAHLWMNAWVSIEEEEHYAHIPELVASIQSNFNAWRQLVYERQEKEAKETNP
jgi:hypothetical protein